MSKLWPKVIRDPVHNIISFEEAEWDRLLLDLINTREFQRLRRIKQLGMSELVFPGANHSRFAHSIGVMHVARRMLARLERLVEDGISDRDRTLVLAAALLHDVGHGPFSHAFEKVTLQKHEARTLEIIQSEETEIGKRLREYDRELPDRLAVFFDEDIDEESHEASEVPRYLTQVVSSQLDADRFDYLLRDSHATGTNYGRFDLDWLLSHLMLDGERGRFFVGRKAIDSAEAYIFARYHSYRSVYFHKTVRAAEVMVRLCMKRYRSLLSSIDSERRRREVCPDAPPAVYDAFTSENLPLERFLHLDDHAMMEFFKACSASSDQLLRDLGSGLTNRKLYKAVEASGSEGVAIAAFSDEAHALVRRKRMDEDFVFVHDTPANTPYKLYDPDDDVPAAQIYAEAPDGHPTEISRVARPLEKLRERFTLTRYYVPETIRDEIDAIASRTLREEMS